MDEQRFAQIVARLERDSAAHPRLYLAKVGLVAMLGFLILAALVASAGLGLLLLLGLVVAVVASGGAALLLLFKLGKLLVLVAVPLWFLMRQAIAALFTRLPAPQGQPIDRAQAPALWATLDDMRRRLRGPQVHQVLLVDEMNAAVVQRPLFGLVGFPRNHLILGLPLLEAMTPDEALAVVAHEYGHLAGAHGRFGAFIYRLRRSWSSVAGVAQQWQGFFGRLLGRAVGAYAPWFNAYTFVLARANEYQADRSGADLVGAGVMADALKRSNLATPQHQAFLGAVFAQIGDQPRPPADLALRWSQQAAGDDAQAARWLGEALDHVADVADTHPTLRQRLAALQHLADADQAPARRQGPSAAERWLGEALPALREQAQRQWHDAVADGWQQRHRAIAEQRTRLAGLRAQAERSADEEFERLQLSGQLEPQLDLRDELAALAARQPGHGPTQYLLALAELEHGDAGGLDRLERLMVQDPEATLPACERAHAWCRAQGQLQRAEAYGTRWRERAAMEQARRQQAEHFDARHALAPAQLDEAVQHQVQATLQRLDRRGIQALYLVRRVLPADAQLGSWVLGVDIGWWQRRLGRQKAIVQRLATADWPLPLFVVPLRGNNAGFGRRLRKVADARLM
ncbi:M48 family metalloprotease [Aquabacterium sp. OR-4]|uniref:M48 family metalloprotease n=1 Tax=Aquabacterium sp. OR-4 TaxID=2978127 RepID=UPI0021B39299|nr:M48 family metallopeptidase [Aquabacterium sp. OR-4]MDT7835557.1 M48 family metalloprotease [Aquabacterium sp. OR-4]